METTFPAFVIRSSRSLRGRRWRWTLVARNGQVVAVSEAYNTRRAAIEGTDAVTRAAEDATLIFDDDASS